jgi:hypothetical protein
LGHVSHGRFQAEWAASLNSTLTYAKEDKFHIQANLFKRGNSPKLATPFLSFFRGGPQRSPPRVLDGRAAGYRGDRGGEALAALRPSWFCRVTGSSFGLPRPPAGKSGPGKPEGKLGPRAGVSGGVAGPGGVRRGRGGVWVPSTEASFSFPLLLCFSLSICFPPLSHPLILNFFLLFKIYSANT